MRPWSTAPTAGGTLAVGADAAVHGRRSATWPTAPAPTPRLQHVRFASSTVGYCRRPDRRPGRAPCSSLTTDGGQHLDAGSRLAPTPSRPSTATSSAVQPRRPAARPAAAYRVADRPGDRRTAWTHAHAARARSRRATACSSARATAARLRRRPTAIPPAARSAPRSVLWSVERTTARTWTNRGEPCPQSPARTTAAPADRRPRRFGDRRCARAAPAPAAQFVDHHDRRRRALPRRLAHGAGLGRRHRIRRRRRPPPCSSRPPTPSAAPTAGTVRPARRERGSSPGDPRCDRVRVRRRRARDLRRTAAALWTTTDGGAPGRVLPLRLNRAPRRRQLALAALECQFRERLTPATATAPHHTVIDTAP